LRDDISRRQPLTRLDLVELGRDGLQSIDQLVGRHRYRQKANMRRVGILLRRNNTDHACAQAGQAANSDSYTLSALLCPSRSRSALARLRAPSILAINA
jgi:hypothetical protein